MQAGRRSVIFHGYYSDYKNISHKECVMEGGESFFLTGRFSFITQCLFSYFQIFPSPTDPMTFPTELSRSCPTKSSKEVRAQSR